MPTEEPAPYAYRPPAGAGVRRASRRTADEVRRHLHGQILSGEMVAGQRVDLDEIAEALEVSRTPVREALLQLEAEGLIKRVPYRGAVVSGVDLRVVEEVLALRLHLESLAARVGVVHLDDADLVHMRAVIDELEAAGTDFSEPRNPFNDLNRDFHETLYRRANSASLLRFIDMLSTQADRIRLHYGVQRNVHVHEQHQRILQACIARDPDEASAAVRAHIVAVIGAFLELLPELELTPGSPLWHALTPDELAELLTGASAAEGATPPVPEPHKRAPKPKA